jgi:hypothetical protein
VAAAASGNTGPARAKPKPVIRQRRLGTLVFALLDVNSRARLESIAGNNVPDPRVWSISLRLKSLTLHRPLPLGTTARLRRASAVNNSLAKFFCELQVCANASRPVVVPSLISFHLERSSVSEIKTVQGDRFDKIRSRRAIRIDDSL